MLCTGVLLHSPSAGLLWLFHIGYGATQLDGGYLAFGGDKEQGARCMPAETEDSGGAGGLLCFPGIGGWSSKCKSFGKATWQVNPGWLMGEIRWDKIAGKETQFPSLWDTENLRPSQVQFKLGLTWARMEGVL